MIQILDVLEIPDPMPFSCRPNGSGEPIALDRIGCHSASFSGRESRLMIRPFDVPPLTKDAVNDLVVIVAINDHGKPDFLAKNCLLVLEENGNATLTIMSL